MIWVLIIIAIIAFCYYMSKNNSNDSSATSTTTKSNSFELPSGFMDSSMKELLETCFGPLNQFPNSDYSRAIIDYRKRVAGQIPETMDNIDIYSYFSILCNGLKAIKNSELMRKVFPEPVQAKGEITLHNKSESGTIEIHTVFYKGDGISCIWELAEEGTLNEPGFRMNGMDEDGFVYLRDDIPFSNDYFSIGFISKQLDEKLPFATIEVGVDNDIYKSVKFSFTIASV